MGQVVEIHKFTEILAGDTCCKMYSKILLLRQSLVLPKSGLIIKAVLILNVEQSFR